MPLHLVATPIGNLDDITLRALAVLKSVDVIACEDTRVTRRLLDRHGITARLEAFHEHNEQRRAGQLAEAAASGKSIALVSNAGTPSLSDPGFRLVRACIDLGVQVIPVPGPSAVVCALIASGLPTHRFTYLGFPPRKSGGRRRMFESVAEFDGSILFYESPLRVGRALADAHEVLGDRRACLAREISKMHEEMVRGTLGELSARYAETPPRGECTVVIEGVSRQTQSKD